MHPQQVEASPEAVPTLQTHFKARPSSIKRHRDLFLLHSLPFPSAQSLLASMPGCSPGSTAAREGRHFGLCLFLPLPGDMPWLPSTAGIALPEHPCPLHPQVVTCRAALHRDRHVRAETQVLIVPRASRELVRTLQARFHLEVVWVPSIKPA